MSSASSNNACGPSPNQDRRSAPELESLNIDTLDLLFRHLERKMDLLSVMHTCRRFFTIGLPILLGREITLNSTRALRSFHEFLVFAHPASTSAVRSLIIGIKHPQHPETLELISRILKRAPYLQTLCINTDAIYWDVAAQTISSMTGLRELEMTGDPFSDEARSMLCRLRCPLSRIHLSRLDAIMHHLLDRDSPNSYVNPTPILAQFQASLEEVSLSMMVLECPSVPFSCPKVACVKMDTFSRTPLSTLVPLFPNAQILIMKHLSVDLGAETNAQKQSRRDDNITFQQEQQRWQSLLAVEATWDSLYTIALRSEVTSLHITTDIDGWRNFSSPILEDLFHHLRPQHLRLSSYYIPFSFAHLLKGGLSRLQRLDVSLHLSVEPQPGMIFGASPAVGLSCMQRSRE
ncbi:hypothetical protein EIP86_003997 [Pleurotus ostreatoroseus]|nr:hypothetical protein EIP86_003997 [Pleurotus ostreatoroseus]